MTDPIAFPTGEQTQPDTASRARTATVDEHGLVTAWSEAAAHLLGYTPAEVLGQPATRLLADATDDADDSADAGHLAWHRTAAAARNRVSAVVTLRHRDGHPVPQRLLAHRTTPHPT
ncbi:PAS domain-containing protein, partial [Streptomyces sp. Da 82-17]|uniref:PAS domain-containing protein n=1 Tax=Streptomyces sp. Da 82-17 TaxID=3377116 RepID=UPI0038D3D852